MFVSEKGWIRGYICMDPCTVHVLYSYICMHVWLGGIQMAVHSGWFTTWFPFQTATTSTLFFVQVNNTCSESLYNEAIAIQGNPVGLD